MAHLELQFISRIVNMVNLFDEKKNNQVKLCMHKRLNAFSLTWTNGKEGGENEKGKY